MKNDKNSITRSVFSSYFLFGIGSILILLITLIILIEDEIPKWASYQNEYKQIALTKAQNEIEIKSIQEFSTEVKQIIIEPLDIVDRCVTCHIGITDPKMKDVRQPLTSHPGNYLETHLIENYGCTVCHGGSGMATIEIEAHGDDDPTFYPMLRGVYIQASCAKCHSENQFTETSVLGTGKRLFDLYGCKVCHKLYKSGGTAGPDLTEVGGKKYLDFSWGEQYEGKQLISTWFINHFKNPSYYYDSKMMDFKMTEENAVALSVYMLSLIPKNLPGEYIHRPNKNN